MVKLGSALILSFALMHARATTLYLAGDSTMAADDGNDAIIGWGTKVGAYLATDLAIENDAIAGTSARTFTDEGRFDSIINAVEADDIVVIEFGHNDGGGATVSTGDCPGADTETTCDVNGTIVHTFNYYIENVVNSLIAKNAKVIVSSQTPDNPYNTSFSPSRFVGYAETAASDTGAWYVDHFDLVNAEYEALGEDAVNALYPVDHTHTSPTGADYVAQTFVRGVLCDSTNPLYEFVTNSSVVPSGCVSSSS